MTIPPRICSFPVAVREPLRQRLLKLKQKSVSVVQRKQQQAKRRD
jgi:hypothetical protein